MTESKRSTYLADGRRADHVISADIDASGDTRTVTETYEEPQIEKKLTRRTIEYSKPTVYRREHEVIDESGNIQEKITEATHEPQLEIREHITTNQVQAQSTAETPCYVTYDDLQRTFAEGFETIARLINNEPEAPLVSAQSLIEANQATTSNKSEWVAYTIWGSIGIAAAVFVYVAFIL